MPLGGEFNPNLQGTRANLNVTHRTLQLNGNVASSSSTTGTLIVKGGIGITGTTNLSGSFNTSGGAVNINNSGSSAINIGNGSYDGTITIGLGVLTGSATTMEGAVTFTNGAGSSVLFENGLILSPGEDISLLTAGTLFIGDTTYTTTLNLQATATGIIDIGTAQTSGGIINIGSSASEVILSGLTASEPVLTNASKQLISGQINLASSSYVTGLLALANGGTNANLTASNGGIFYSTASAGAILSGTATAGQLLISGASTTPAWTTTTYPSTNAVNTVLYASSANVMAALATANNAVLCTNASGVPAMTATGTFSATTITASITGHASLDLPLTGGTLTGTLTVNSGGASTAPLNIATSSATTNSFTLALNGTTKVTYKYDTTNGVQILGPSAGVFITQGGTTAGAVSTTNNQLDNGSGVATFNATGSTGITSNITATGNAFVANVSAASTNVFTLYEINSVSKVAYGWQTSVGINIIDKVAGTSWLSQGTGTAGYVASANNILDNGSGAATIAGLLSLSTGFQLPSSGATATTNNFYATITYSTTSSGIWSAAQSTTLYVTRNGNVVTLYLTSTEATSNTASIITVAQTLPSWAFPIGAALIVPCSIKLGGLATGGSIQVTSAGVIKVYINAAGGNFDGNGSVEGFDDISISYIT